MSSENPPVIDPTLIARVKYILTRPKLEWPVIDAEFATTRSLFARYAMILAAIGPVAGLIGGQMLPRHALDMVIRTPIVGGLLGAILTWGFWLVLTFVLGLAIDILAPTFGGTRNKLQAMKVAVYAMTPAWLAGIFNLFPSLAALGALLGLYGCYLLYLGLGAVMKAPQDKVLGYAVVVTLAAMLLSMVAWSIIGGMVAIVQLGAIGVLGMGFS